MLLIAALTGVASARLDEAAGARSLSMVNPQCKPGGELCIKGSACCSGHCQQCVSVPSQICSLSHASTRHSSFFSGIFGHCTSPPSPPPPSPPPPSPSCAVGCIPTGFGCAPSVDGITFLGCCSTGEVCSLTGTCPSACIPLLGNTTVSGGPSQCCPGLESTTAPFTSGDPIPGFPGENVCCLPNGAESTLNPEGASPNQFANAQDCCKYCPLTRAPPC